MKLILQVACWFLSLAGSYMQIPMIFKELHMEGFIVTRWDSRREEGVNALLKWVVEVRKDGRKGQLSVRCTQSADSLFAESLVIAVQVRS